MNIWDIFGIYLGYIWRLLKCTEYWGDGMMGSVGSVMIQWSVCSQNHSVYLRPGRTRSDQVEACAVPKVWSSGKKMSWLSYGYTLGIPGVNIQKDVENLWLPQEKWCINAGFSTVMSWLSHAFVLEKMFPAVYRPNWDSKCNPRHRWGKSSAKKNLSRDKTRFSVISFPCDFPVKKSLGSASLEKGPPGVRTPPPETA